MITQDEFLAIADSRPEMKRAFQAAVHATVVFRKEAAKNKRGILSQLRLRKRGFSAIFLTNRVLSGFIYNGQPASEQDKELIRSWIVGAAEFEMDNSN